MRIVDYVRPELVRFDLPDEGVADAIHRMVDQVARALELPEVDALERALLAREAAHTTSLDHGIAVPHTTLAGLDDSVIAVGVAADRITFGPEGTSPVRVLFLLLSPPDGTALHIKLLARLARLARRGGFVEELASARTADEFVARLTAVESEQG
jgi:mannitol/fructose-specific phosphotransferase system IIA component (Ntr-type)